MGFLDTAPEDATPAPEAAKPYGGFLSDNPPPETKPVEKAPEWSEIPAQALVNAPESALQFGKSMIQPIMHPIDTAESIGKLALGSAQKLGIGKDLTNYEAYPEAVGKMVMDRYGSIDNFKKTLATDPVGFAGDLSMLLSGGETALGRLPGVVGKVGETLGTVGRVVDPLALPTAAVKGAGHVIPEIMGHRTGVGPEAIKQAAQTGYEGDKAAREAFTSNLNQTVPLEDVVDQANTAINNMVKNKNANYKQGIADAKLDQPISAASAIKISDAITEASDIGKHKGWAYNEGALTANQDLHEIVQSFFQNSKGHPTLEGLDALKQAIGDYNREHIDPGSKASIVGNTYYKAVRNAIQDEAPGYAKVMDNYSAAKEQLTQIQKSFSLPPDQRKLNVDTALRKLQSVLRNNVNTNWGFREGLMRELEKNGAPNLRQALAGQALNTGTPRGLARISFEAGAEVATALGALFTGHPWLIAPAVGAFATTMATSSPKIVGKTAYGLGRAARPLKYVPRKTPQTLQQVGRWTPNQPLQVYVTPDQQNRGGAVGRALRATKR